MPKAASSKGKASSARRSEPIQYIYVVTETESGPYQETENKILGIYESKTQANQSANTFARSTEYEHYWDRDEDKPGYPEETQDANGCISIEAEDEEGDLWKIAVARHIKTPMNDPTPKAKGGATSTTAKGEGAATTTATKKKTSTPTTGTSTHSSATNYVYLVWKIEDPCGESEKEVKRIYKSKDEANQYAISMARKNFPDWFVQKGERGYDQDNPVFADWLVEETKVCKDANGCIFMAATDERGDSIKIKVEKQILYV